MRTRHASVALLVVIATVSFHQGRASLVDGGSDCGAENQVAEVPVVFHNDGTTVAIQFDMLYDAAVVTPGLPIRGNALADHILQSNVTSPGTLRVVAYSPTNAHLLDGTLVTVPFTLAPSVPQDVLLLPVPTNGPGYTGPGAIVASLAAIRQSPDATPTSGRIDIVHIAGPSSAAACIGGTVTFSVAVSGGGSSAYQWTKDGVPISGATAAAHTVNPVGFSSIGGYLATITNSCGSFASGQAVLDVEGVCAPDALAAYDTGIGGELGLVWTLNPSPDVNKYRLYWGPTQDGPYTSSQDLAVGDHKTLSGFNDNIPYFFRVSAVADSLESAFSNESSAVPTGERLRLPQERDYGYQTTPSNDTLHPGVVTYRFEGRPGEVTLWYEVYDIDRRGEAEIRLNGLAVAQPDTTVNSSWSGRRSIVLPDTMVNDTEPNVLTFSNLDYSLSRFETWGARRVSLKLPAPEVTAFGCSDSIVLTIKQARAEAALAGYDIFRGTTPVFVPSPSNRIATLVGGGLYFDQTASGLDPYFYLVRPLDSIDNPGSDSARATPTAMASDFDGDGVDECGGDCDDTLVTVHSGLPETCTDGLDNDCDGQVDVFDSDCASATCPDLDADDFVTCNACQPEEGNLCGDCNDLDRNVNAGATELCNGVDDDCDGAFDEGTADSFFYRDADGDGYGDPSNSVIACVAPSGFVAAAGDCNDGSRTIHPGVADLCNALDDDCDPTTPDGRAETWYAQPCDGNDADACVGGGFVCATATKTCNDGAGNDDRCTDFDVNGDTRLNGVELAWWGRAFGLCSVTPASEWWNKIDLNHDGCIDGEDLSILGANGVWDHTTANCTFQCR